MYIGYPIVIQDLVSKGKRKNVSKKNKNKNKKSKDNETELKDDLTDINEQKKYEEKTMIMIKKHKQKCERIKMIHILSLLGMDENVLEEYFESIDHGIMANFQEEKKKKRYFRKFKK